VWLRPERGGDRKLNRERMVGRAVAVLDAEGMDALSMRRLATELDVTVGALYWYVATKDDLLELALDAVLGEVRTDAPGDGWRAGLTAYAHRYREVLLRHPWVMGLLGRLPNTGPNALALSDEVLVVIERAGFRRLTDVLAAVHDHVVGAAVAQVSWREALARTGAASADVIEHVRATAERHPLLASVMSPAPQGPADVDAVCAQRFAFALDCLLDGLAAHLPATDGDQ